MGSLQLQVTLVYSSVTLAGEALVAEVTTSSVSHGDPSTWIFNQVLKPGLKHS